MKKIYNAPEITVIEQEIEPFMLDTSVISGGELPDGAEIQSKGGFFENEDDFDDWNGWK